MNSKVHIPPTARKIVRLVALAAAVAAILLSLANLAGAAASEKVIRQIGVMEKIVDKVLVDSPNFLVQRGDNTRGLYIDGFGVVFTFDASLVNEFYGIQKLFSLEDRFEMKTDEDGNQVFVIKKGSKEELEAKKEELESKRQEAEKAVEKVKKSSDEKMKDRAKLYADGQAELVQALLDYGETMTSLTDDNSIILAAFLKDDDYFKEQRISRLILEAKMRDLRAFSSGSISAETMKSRISVEDY